MIFISTKEDSLEYTLLLVVVKVKISNNFRKNVFNFEFEFGKNVFNKEEMNGEKATNKKLTYIYIYINKSNRILKKKQQKTQ